MDHHFRHHCGTLYHAGIRRQVALQNGDTADLAVGIVNGSDDLRVTVYTACNVFADGLAGYGNQICVQQVLLI